MAKVESTYLVLADTREQNGWSFSVSGRCRGTKSATLKTGDYSLEGLEESFVIERKGSVAEFAANLFQARFDRELDRLDAFAHPFLVLEFEFADLVRFPEGSGIPKWRWKSLRVTPQLLVKRLTEIHLAHPRLQVVFAGKFGREFASSLFKRITDRHAEKQ